MDADFLLPRTWWPQHCLEQLQPPDGLRPWLLHTGSLTRRLQDRWPELQVCLVHVGTGRLTPEEARRLDRPAQSPAWIRCVSLRARGRTRVRARAVIPDWHPYNPWSPVADLGERPLGPWLFQQPGLLRSPFEWACPDASAGTGSRGDGVWARRSSFLRHGAPLLLTEWLVDLLDAPGPHRSSHPTPLTA
jgi:chorismate lyase